MTIEETLAALKADPFVQEVAERLGQPIEKVALDWWELDQVGLIDQLFDDLAAATELSLNRAERRQVGRRQGRYRVKL